MVRGAQEPPAVARLSDDHDHEQHHHPPMDERMDAPTGGARSALETTFTVASTAANLVFLPYKVAGKAAYQVTAFAVSAPMRATRHVASSISGSRAETDEEAVLVDLFGEHEQQQEQEQTADTPETEHPVADLFGERCALKVANTTPVVSEVDGVTGVLFVSEAPVAVATLDGTSSINGDAETGPTPGEDPIKESQRAPIFADAAATTTTRDAACGGMAQLIFLPVRAISSGVSTAAALPATAIAFGGRTLSGAVSQSQSLASAALVASTNTVARTSLTVAQGLTLGAFSTAHRVTGLVGSSVRHVSYAIPPSVSRALRQGMAHTGDASTSVISYAIAVPAYRMAYTLAPEIVSEFVTEQQCVEATKEGVRVLVQVLGPQNAFYVLKYVYETVNSDEAYDIFLLCRDMVRESMDVENYRAAGSSIGSATGVKDLLPVMKEIYAMLPSLEELVDAVEVVADVSGELTTTTSGRQSGVIAEEAWLAPGGKSPHFETLSSEEEDYSDGDSDLDEQEHQSVALDVAFALGTSKDEELDETEESEKSEESEPRSPTFTFSFDGGFSFEGSDDDEDELHQERGDIRTGREDAVGELFDAGMSFFTAVCDSEEASALFNTFGDFVDVLVE